MLDADVLLQVLFFLPQGDIASVARSSQWLWNVAQSALYQHPLTRGIPRAYSLARTVSDTRCTLSVKSMHLCALGAGEATTTAQWNDVQDAILRALRSTSCVALERFKIDIVLPSFMHNARAAWGEPIWGVLRESCPKLRWIEVNHNAFNGETQLALLPNLRGLTLCANMPGGAFEFPATHLLEPLESLSPDLEHLELDMRKDFVYPIQIDTMFQRSWPRLRVLNLSWGYYESTMCDLCAFLERHVRLEHLTIRGITPPRITHIADGALPALRAFDGDMDVAQCILASPRRAVVALSTWTWDLDTIVAALRALPRPAAAALRVLDIKFVAHMEVASGVTGAALRALAAAAPGVEDLTLRGVLTGEWGWPAYRDALADFRSLARLSMATPTLVGGMPLSRAMNELARRLPMLVYVDLAVGLDDALAAHDKYGQIAVRRRADT